MRPCRRSSPRYDQKSLLAALLEDLPYLTDSAVAQVEDENDLRNCRCAQRPVMQADRVLSPPTTS